MHQVWIKKTTHALISAHVLPGRFLLPPIEERVDEVLLELDDQVFERLNALDADANKAIAMLCAGQVGNA